MTGQVIVSLEERAEDVRERAKQARRFAETCGDDQLAANLLSHAKDLEVQADKLQTMWRGSEVRPIPAQAIPEMSNEPNTGPEAIAAMQPSAPKSQIENVSASRETVQKLLINWI